MAYRDKLARMCFDAMLLGVALLLSYLEAILPLTVWLPLPGFKLGLANMLITLAFAAVSPFDAAIISLSRICIMGILFGNLSSFAFSLSGGIFSYIGLWIFAKFGQNIFSMIGISVGCAALHNMGQLFAASFLLGSEVIVGYLPMLLVAALIFGTVTGSLLQIVFPRFAALIKNKGSLKL